MIYFFKKLNRKNNEKWRKCLLYLRCVPSEVSNWEISSQLRPSTIDLGIEMLQVQVLLGKKL